MKLKLDLHVHTTNSKDAHTLPTLLAALCRKARIDGIAITDHNVLPKSVPDAMTVIPGIEISTAQGHVIGLGISEPVAKGLSADETIRQIRRLGGLVIIPHPYDMLRSSVTPETLTIRPDAIEVVNSASFMHSLTWRRAKRFAESRRLPAVAGSDSHIPETLGIAFTVADADSREVSSILEAIRSGSVEAKGRPVRLTERLRKLLAHRYGSCASSI